MGQTPRNTAQKVEQENNRLKKKIEERTTRKLEFQS